MNKQALLIFLTFFSLILTGCQEKSTSRKSSSSNALNCSGNNYYTLPGCVGYCQYNPTATVCSTNNNSCSGQAYWTTPGCGGFCQYNPSSPSCGGGGTTGTTTGGTTSGGTTGTTNNCALNPYSYQCYCQTYPMATGCPSGGTSLYPNWGVMYPPTGSAPDNSASSCTSYNPSGVTQAYDVRKATVTVVGGQWYNPTSASQLYNTSSSLKSVANAVAFFQTDSMLKVRFKVKPQPHAANTTNTCYGRVTGQSYIAGYYKLKFNVKLVGKRADNTTGEEFLGVIEGNVNTCTPAIDLSNYVGMYPNGVHLVISDVQSNQGTWPANYSTYGFRDGNTWKTVRTSDCWTMDIEVAADGTKTFD
jgi:hypothetical protein